MNEPTHADAPVTGTEQVSGRSNRKDPEKVARMRAINEAGRNGMGGRRPIHGRKALAELVRRGEQYGYDDAIADRHRELTAGYTADLGGERSLSFMERAAIKRAVVLDFQLDLWLAERDKTARMSFARRLALDATITKNILTHCQVVRTLGGPSRRPGQAGGKVIIQRFAEPKPERPPEPEPEEIDSQAEPEESEDFEQSNSKTEEN